jgi:hypothetical protein
MSREKIIYVASLFALITAGALAWAVSHPCDCAKDQAAVDDLAQQVAE